MLYLFNIDPIQKINLTYVSPLLSVVGHVLDLGAIIVQRILPLGRAANAAHHELFRDRRENEELKRTLAWALDKLTEARAALPKKLPAPGAVDEVTHICTKKA